MNPYQVQFSATFLHTFELVIWLLSLKPRSRELYMSINIKSLVVMLDNGVVIFDNGLVMLCRYTCMV